MSENNFRKDTIAVLKLISLFVLTPIGGALFYSGFFGFIGACICAFLCIKIFNSFSTPSEDKQFSNNSSSYYYNDSSSSRYESRYSESSWDSDYELGSTYADNNDNDYDNDYD